MLGQVHDASIQSLLSETNNETSGREQLQSALFAISVALAAWTFLQISLLFGIHIISVRRLTEAERGGHSLTFATVCCVALLVCLVGAMGVLVFERSRGGVDIPDRMDSATMREWIVGRTLMTANRMNSDFSYLAVGRNLIKADQATFAATLSKVYRTCVGRDHTQDSLLFKPGNTEGVINHCRCNKSLCEQGVEMAKEGVSYAFEGPWRRVTTALAEAETRADIADAIVVMNRISKPLIQALAMSSERHNSQEKHVALMWLGGVIAAVVFVLLAEVLAYVTVMRLFFNELSSDESSAKDMIRHIPADVVESHTQISAFVLTGSVGFDAEHDIERVVESTSTVPLVVINAKGTILRFSKAAERMFHYDSSDVLGANVKVLMPEDVAVHHDKYLSSYRRTHTKRVIDQTRRFVGKRKNGSLFPLEICVREYNVGVDETVYFGVLRDVSQLVEADAKESLLKVTLELSRLPFVISDAFGSILIVNEATLSTFGYTREELIHENVKVLMPSDMAMHHDRFLQKRRDLKGSQALSTSRNVQAQRRNGDLFEAHITLQQVDMSRGSEYSWIVACIADLTVDKIADTERELQDAVLDLSPIPVVAVDVQGAIIRFSRAAEKAFGWTRQELVSQGHALHVLLPPSYGEQQSLIEKYLETHDAQALNNPTPVVCARQDGSCFAAVAHVKEILNKEGSPAAFVAYLRETSNEAGLERETQLFSSVVESSVNCVVIADAEGIIQSFNASACRAFGYTAEEAIGSDLTILMPPDKATVHSKALKRYRQTGTKVFMDRQQHVLAARKDGTTFPIEIVVRETEPTNAAPSDVLCAYPRCDD